MRRFFPLVVVVVVAVLTVTTCTDSSLPVDIEDPDLADVDFSKVKSQGQVLDLPSNARITVRIAHRFPARRGTLGDAMRRWTQIKKDLKRGELEQARVGMYDLVGITLTLLAAGELDDPFRGRPPNQGADHGPEQIEDQARRQGRSHAGPLGATGVLMDIFDPLRATGSETF